MGGKYKRVADAFAAGDRSMLIEPLDYMILDVLPAEGTNVAGLYQVGETVEQLQKKFPVGTPVLSSRMRALRILGLTVMVKMVGTRGTHAWQTTAKGREVANQWKAQEQPSA